jgi:hypothetical protein
VFAELVGTVALQARRGLLLGEPVVRVYTVAGQGF